jgi:hypothetical protein
VNDVEVGSLTGFGGELGYRFYTGSKGANGFFAGPSVLFASAAGSSTPAAPWPMLRRSERVADRE